MSFWAVARTLPQREAFAAERLQEGGFEVFLPKVKTDRASEPLFHNYVFVKIIDQWRAVDRTLGILRLVRFGEQPARCPDAEIAALRSRIDATGFVRLPAKPSKARRVIPAGAAIRIVGGPFEGVSAIYAGQSHGERELILIAMLGGQRRVAVASHLIAPR
jgi:transcriptional antiterminator RfaH